MRHSIDKYFNYTYFWEALKPNFLRLHAKMLEICSRLNITSTGNWMCLKPAKIRKQSKGEGRVRETKNKN